VDGVRAVPVGTEISRAQYEAILRMPRRDRDCAPPPPWPLLFGMTIAERADPATKDAVARRPWRGYSWRT
jgi:hypothetical protein